MPLLEKRARLGLGARCKLTCFRNLAAKLAPTIRVNAIAPSMIDTRLAQRFLSSPDRQQAVAERHSLKTYGQPSNIAAMATFLLKDTFKWMSDQIFQVNGGMSSVRLFQTALS
ncbi:SDR family oxidoreductase [candidate division KSB1 bacterium]|nr:SDR family oxidoreductase [candidate division KSB1 bacterium]